MTPVDRIDLSGAPFNLDAAGESWVRGTLGLMTLTEKLGQLLMPMLLAHDEATVSRLTRLGAGGIFLFHAATERLRETSARFQAASRLPMLIAGDLEFGEMAPLDGLAFTSQLGVAATGDDIWAERLGLLAARAGRRCGYNWSLTPVIDIDFNPHSPVVNTRSFGSDPARVGHLGKLYIEAAQSGGIAACAKHWPGDGIDYRDQHLVTAVNGLSMADWRATYGRCYQQAIAAGVKSVMSAHIALPNFHAGMETEASAPASLSSRLNNDLLRGEFGFNGLIVTDATTMAGFGACGPREAIIADTIASGCDLILFTPDAEIDRIYLERAVFDGRLSIERVDAAATRILALKASLNLHLDRSIPDISDTEREEDLAWEQACARASITLVRDSQGLLPLNPETHGRLLLFEEGMRPGPMGPLPSLGMQALLEARGFEVTRFAANTVVDARLFDAALYVVAEEAALCKGDLRMDWKALHHGTIRSMERFWHTIPCALLSLGNPYHHLDAPDCGTLINAYSASPAVQQAAVEAITGAIPFAGQSPVDPLGGDMAAFAPLLPGGCT